jgi:AbrB family looped-hinge helix DNA binding protein
MQKYCKTANMPTKAILSDRGVITIPASIRQAFGLKANDELLIEQTDQGILLRPVISVPLEVYSEKRIADFASDEAAIGKLLQKRKRR